MDQYLQPTEFFDYENPELKSWIAEQLQGVPDDPVEQIKRSTSQFGTRSATTRTYSGLIRTPSVPATPFSAASPTVFRKRFC